MNAYVCVRRFMHTWFVLESVRVLFPECVRVFFLCRYDVDFCSLLQGKLFVSFEVVFPKNGQIDEANAGLLVKVPVRFLCCPCVKVIGIGERRSGRGVES